MLIRIQLPKILRIQIRNPVLNYILSFPTKLSGGIMSNTNKQKKFKVLSNEKRYGRLKHWFQSTIEGEARLFMASHRIGLQQIDAGLTLAGKDGTQQVWIKFTDWIIVSLKSETYRLIPLSTLLLKTLKGRTIFPHSFRKGISFNVGTLWSNLAILEHNKNG